MKSLEIVAQTSGNELLVPESQFAPITHPVESRREQILELISIEGEPTPIEKELAEENYQLCRRSRIDIEKARKSMVEGAVKYQKTVNSIAKEFSEEVSDWETALLSVSKYHERQEEARIAKLTAERELVLREFVDDVKQYNVASMSDEIWDITINGLKVAKEQKIAAQKKLEEEAAAKAKEEAEERERMRLENERLRREAQEAEAAAKKERDAAAAEAARLRAIAEEEKRKAEAAAKKIEDDRLAALAEEEKRKKEEADAAAKAAAAPDKEKIIAYLNSIMNVKIGELVTDEAFRVKSKVMIFIDEAVQKSYLEVGKL